MYAHTNVELTTWMKSFYCNRIPLQERITNEKIPLLPTSGFVDQSVGPPDTWIGLYWVRILSKPESFFSRLLFCNFLNYTLPAIISLFVYHPQVKDNLFQVNKSFHRNEEAPKVCFDPDIWLRSSVATSAFIKVFFSGFFFFSNFFNCFSLATGWYWMILFHLHRYLQTLLYLFLPNDSRQWSD